MNVTYRSNNPGRLIKHALTNNPIQQGIVGIQLPEIVKPFSKAKPTLYGSLFILDKELPYDVQFIILPPPVVGFNKNAIQLEALKRRIHRDHDDGVRYNRVYLALYDDKLGELTANEHDLFIKLENERGTSFYISQVQDFRSA